MRKVRIGNDINVRWEVKTDGQAVSLEGKTLKLYVRSAYRKEEITTFVVEGCVISFTYPASMQRMTGARAVILEDATEGAPRRTVCADQAFTLVAHSCEENDDDVEFEDFMVSLQSNVLIGKHGLSAYEVWLSEGNTGTLENWYAFLRQPATDIAADVTEAEAARVEAEKQRVEAETARQDNEAARQEAEEGRAEAELKRTDAEQKRADAELLRKNAETKREQAEEKREEAIDGFGKDLNDLAEKLGLKADKNETVVEIKRLTGKVGREWNAETDIETCSDFYQYLLKRGNYCGIYIKCSKSKIINIGYNAFKFANHRELELTYDSSQYRLSAIIETGDETSYTCSTKSSNLNEDFMVAIVPAKLFYSGIEDDYLCIVLYNISGSGIIYRNEYYDKNGDFDISIIRGFDEVYELPACVQSFGFISYTNSNNYRVKYADGRYALINADKNVVIGGKDYNADTNYHATGFGENGTTFTRGGTLEVNGSAQVRDLTTRSITANGSVTINHELKVKDSISTSSTLKAGETTIKGTLHCETHDIKTKSVYPAGTGSSSLKDPSLGAVKGNYVVNKGNLGKPAHNYDKLFVENIYWSDRTDLLNPETHLNTDYWTSAFRLFAKEGYKGRPTIYTDFRVYNELESGTHTGIYSDNEDYVSNGENITMFTDGHDSDSDVASFRFDLSHGYIKYSKWGNSSDSVFGNGVMYDAKTKIPATFVDLSAKADLVDGKVPLSQLGNVDTQIVLVVDALPTENIKSNKIYLVKNTASEDTENIYTEYVYINNKWEELGKYKPEVDLSEYIKSNEIYQCIKKEYDSSKRGKFSIAIDDSAIASGRASTAIGVDTKVKYDYCVVVGCNSVVSDSDSVVLGVSSSANKYSVAVGTSSNAKGHNSIALGFGSNTSKNNGIAIGKNAKNNKSIFSVGFNGVNGIDMDEDNYGLYLKGFGGYTGTNLTVNNAAGKEVLNPDIKSVQEIINGKVDITPIIASTDAAIALQPNKKYEITAGDTLTLTLTEPVDNTVVNEYKCAINTGNNVPTATFPQNVIWATEPVIEANRHYEISIIYSQERYWGTIQAWNLPTESTINNQSDN